MNEVTVTCACGLEMVLDACRGKGAFRCPRFGCTNRAKVKVTAVTNRKACTVAGCEFGPVANSPENTPLCAGHLSDTLLALLPEMFKQFPPWRWIETARQYEERVGPIPEVPSYVTYEPVPYDRSRTATRHQPVVYFLVIGDQVKIGTTNNLKSRFSEALLPPTAEIVLTLPGSYEEERRLHLQFKHDRVGGEWFTLSTRIKAFIQANQARHLGTSPWLRSSRSTA